MTPSRQAPVPKRRRLTWRSRLRKLRHAVSPAEKLVIGGIGAGLATYAVIRTGTPALRAYAGTPFARKWTPRVAVKLKRLKPRGHAIEFGLGAAAIDTVDGIRQMATEGAGDLYKTIFNRKRRKPRKKKRRG